MKITSQKIIFHIDVNSAFLSWTAITLLKENKIDIDIRKIPSIVGGNSEDRKGVVLAKSIPAKKYDIKTGEPIAQAMKKCPGLKTFSPDHEVYRKFSNAMFNLLTAYSDYIERYSIDEVFMDMSAYRSDYMEKAQEIKFRIEKELGFTVNVGIGNNKLLAKMASDFPKKNSIHIIMNDNIKEKMWPLPVGRLFMVGKSAEKKLRELNIFTIGDLANYNLNILRTIFKSYGDVIYGYANGIDNSEIKIYDEMDVKGIGNSSTTRKDIVSDKEAYRLILALTESVALRLRKNNTLCSQVSVSVKNNRFITYSHQKTAVTPTDSTTEIYELAVQAFRECWKKEPIRQIGVRVGKLSDNRVYQKSIFDDDIIEKKRCLDKTIDQLREKFGDKAIIRSTFLEDEDTSDKAGSAFTMAGLYESEK